MGLLRFIVIVIVVYYLFVLFARYVLPILLAMFVRRAQKNMMGDQYKAQDVKRKKEGEVNVDFIPKKKKKGKKENLGDYTDFEEIKD